RPTRTLRSARFSAAAFRPSRCPRPSKSWSTPISISAPTAKGSSIPIAVSGSSPSRRESMPLVKHGAFIEDEWTAVADDAELPSGGAVTVSLKRWQAERDTLIGRNGKLGLRLPADADPSAVRAD